MIEWKNTVFDNATPFAMILSPLAAIPIILALLFGLSGCAEIIAAAWGFDLAGLYPWLSGDMQIGAPLILFSAALFGLAFMVKVFTILPLEGDRESRKYRVKSRFVHFWLLLMLIAVLTVPYWLAWPVPEAFVVAGVLVAWFGYKKISVSPAQA